MFTNSKKTNVENIIEKLKLKNNGWIKEIFLRNQNNLDGVALFYRGTNVTYYDLFNKIVNYMNFFDKSGLKKGDTISICINNCPELVYIIGAANLCGII